MPRSFTPTLERFHASYVIDESGCWNWTGFLSCGYGRISDNGYRTYAHRWSYENFVGPIPDGLEIDHLCRNRACCNPKHLEPVTRAENMRRSPLMDRHSHRTHCKRGHEFSAENTYYFTERSGNRGRICKACSRARKKALRDADAA